MESEYYYHYRGPELTNAFLWNNPLEKQDIKNIINEYYGSNRNWNGKLIQYDDIFPNKKGYNYYIEFESIDGKKHWFQGEVGEPTQIFNSPLATPISQTNN